jgi:hypothetical protein
MVKKMKKLFAILVIASIVLSLIPLGTAVTAKSLDCKVYYIYEQDFAKPDGVGKVKPPKPDNEPQLYELLGPSWKTLNLNYVIDPTNNIDLDEDLIVNAIYASVETWDAASSANLFSDEYSIDTAEVDLETPYTNTKNEIDFGDIPQANAIAVCLVWSTTRGPPSKRSIVEFDIVFDVVDFDWGFGESDKMDLQNIATHELGHAVGLADLYDDNPLVIEQTMYGYASEGETKKRTLAEGDIEGITVLYGSS